MTCRHQVFALAVSLAASLPVGGLAVAPVAASAAGEVAAPTIKVGDTWMFNHILEQGPAGFKQELRHISVERVDSESMLLAVKPEGSPRAPEEVMVGLDWAQKSYLNGAELVTGRAFSFPMSIGQTWVVEYTDPRTRGMQSNTHVKRTYRVVGWEDVTVPAGTFHALKIEDRGTLDAQVVTPTTTTAAVASSDTGGATITRTQKGGSHEIHETLYGFVDYVPEVKYFVKTLDEHYNADGVRVSRESQELISFKPAAR